MNNKRNLEEMVKVNNHYSRFITEYDMEFRTKHFNLKRLIDMETVNDLGFVFVVVDNGETYYDFETFYHVSEETGELLLDEVLLPQGEEYPLFSSPDTKTVEIPIFYKDEYYLLTLDVDKVLEMDEHLVMNLPTK
jgi:hypothetical protein